MFCRKIKKQLSYLEGYSLFIMHWVTYMEKIVLTEQMQVMLKMKKKYLLTTNYEGKKGNEHEFGKHKFNYMRKMKT